MKKCFSEGKLIKQFGTPLSANPPPHPLFLSNYFLTPLFVQILKIRTPPPRPNFREVGQGNYGQ